MNCIHLSLPTFDWPRNCLKFLLGQRCSCYWKSRGGRGCRASAHDHQATFNIQRMSPLHLSIQRDFGGDYLGTSFIIPVFLQRHSSRSVLVESKLKFRPPIHRVAFPPHNILVPYLLVWRRGTGGRAIGGECWSVHTFKYVAVSCPLGGELGCCPPSSEICQTRVALPSANTSKAHNRSTPEIQSRPAIKQFSALQPLKRWCLNCDSTGMGLGFQAVRLGFSE